MAGDGPGGLEVDTVKEVPMDLIELGVKSGLLPMLGPLLILSFFFVALAFKR
jgi:hypothetical protein